ncbi:MAG: PIN domain-containing protein [Actinobacteria bacterium]|nr:PIN domain-containing protein [Actinomycetota bacterium]
MEAHRPGVVLDAGAVIALLRGEPAAPRVEQLLRDDHSRMSTVNAAETVDVLVRRYGWAAADVVAGVEQLLSTVVDAVPASLDVATQAGDLRARHFRRDQRISLADCFVLATAGPGDSVATGDELLATVARDEGFAVVPL